MKAVHAVKDFLKTEQIKTLTRAKLRALKLLVECGVNECIAFDWFITDIPSIVDGYEDVFVLEALSIFRERSNHKDGATLCIWWLDLSVFTNGVYTDIIKARVNNFIERQKRGNPEAYENRQKAKSLTNDQFESLFAQAA